MSDVILRGLMLPTSNTSVSNTSTANNNNTILKGLQLKEPETQSAETLTTLDSLKLTNSNANSKGSVPIQLMSPDDIGVQQTSTPVRKPRNTTINALAGLKPGSGSVRPRPSGNSALTGITTTSYKPPVTNTQKPNSSTNAAMYSTTLSTVANNNRLGEKLNDAIEKIGTWDRKMGILESEIQKQQNSADSDPSKIISRSSQMATAKKDAVMSREQALNAYRNVMTEINRTFGTNTEDMGAYKNLYLTMEAKYSAAVARDKTVMDKTKDFLKSVMSPDNFNRALNYLNPFN